MPFQFNIGAIKTNSISQNGNIEFGATVQNSHTANTKGIGVNLSFGDFSPSLSYHMNNVLDPDVSDQDQIANPSAPISNQF